MTTKRTLLSVAGTAALIATLMACGGDDGGGNNDGATGWADSDCAQIVEPVNSANPPEGSTVQDGVAVSGSIGEAPVVSVEGNASPASSLVTVDVVQGSGPAVTPGAEVTVQYCGVGLTTRSVFDSSWARGEPISFPLAGVIQGWQEGIPGMQPGGRRLLIIPADLAYGENPPTPAILPGETLIFVVDLLDSTS